jgi:hypothetical protein
MEKKKPDNLEIASIDNKWHAPLLLAASFQNLVKFHGSFSRNGIIHWQFSPKKVTLELINKFETKTEPRIPLLDFVIATDKFWKTVSESKNQRNKENEQSST